LSSLARHLPRLRVPWLTLGDWPTPLEPVVLGGRTVWVKREGDSSPLYGGNKVRTLEAWLGHAQASGARKLWAIGAYGSNHAIATVLHARTIGLDPGAILFPQPASEWAIENAGALIATGCAIVRLRSVVEIPFVGLALAARERLIGDRGGRALVMPPGGASTIGTLGAVSAVLELAEQLAENVAPPPVRIVLAVGSTCTTAGLLAGLQLARAIGLWRWPVPIVHAVRVTPWPVTSKLGIALLAAATLARIERLGGPAVGASMRALLAGLIVDGRELGAGYGRLTPRAASALAEQRRSPDLPRLDGVYSAKAAAALPRLQARGIEPLLFWATKSTAVLPPPPETALRVAPPVIAEWLRRPVDKVNTVPS
jgi:D-cysteine desulfhydrase